MEKKLCKSRTDVKIDGVCAGIAKYLNIDVTVIRVLFIIFGFTSSSVLIYIILAFVMPREEEYIDYTKNQN